MHRAICNIIIFLFAIAITTVNVSAQTDGITLAWDANDPAEQVTEYRLYYKTGTFGPPYDGTGLNQGNSPIIVRVDNLTNQNYPSFDLTGLSPGTTYRFAMTAHNGSESRYSAELLYTNNNTTHTTLSWINIKGPEAVSENSNATYTCRAGYSDGSIEDVNADSWSVDCPDADISTGGILTSDEVARDSQCRIQARYSSGGLSRSSGKDITITDNTTASTVTLSWINIKGPETVNENSNVTYTCRAGYSDGSIEEVPAESWSVDCPDADISTGGTLSSDEVASDTQCRIQARYSSEGKTRYSGKDITITDNNTPTTATLNWINIKGPEAVSENSNATYTCKAGYSDGNIRTVTPDNWAITSGASLANINNQGSLTTHDVAADGTIGIMASYTEGQATRSKEIQVTVNDTDTSPPGSPSQAIQDFQDYAHQANPSGWRDTNANNSMAANDKLFKVFDLSGEKVFGTTSTLTNIHSHYNGADIDDLSAYEYTGRMMMTSSSSGIGVTFFSRYPSADKYYRLRRYKNKPSFHIASHGTNVAGDIDTGVIPSPNVWYRFTILVEDTGSQTKIRAKVWSENSAEPAAWQVDCYDRNSSRLTSGAIGVWSYSTGNKYWDDLSTSGDAISDDPIVTNATLNWINIKGPEAVSENSNATYTCKAGYSDGNIRTVTPDNWVITSGASLANINNQGSLTTHDVAADGTIGIMASYTEGQATRSKEIQVTVNDTDTTNPSAPNEIFQGFEIYADKEDPNGWLDTRANNSMAPNDTLFKVFSKSGKKVFGTTSTQSDIHSHYNGADIDTLSAYEYSGRMMMTASSSGIGVTFFSQYPNKDAYYRLRRYGNSAFHIAPHPHGVRKVYGDTNTGVVPSPNVWYWFRILVEDTGSRTKIRAKVWSENSVEPAGWQVDCYDSSSTRLTSGVVGVWSYSSGAKYWDDISICADSTCASVN